MLAQWVARTLRLTLHLIPYGWLKCVDSGLKASIASDYYGSFLRWGKFHLECTRKSHSKQLRQSLYHLVSVFCNIGKIFLKINFYVYVRCNADFNVIQFWALGQAGNFYTYSKNIMLIFWLRTIAWWETKILPTISNDLNQASLQKFQKIFLKYQHSNKPERVISVKLCKFIEESQCLLYIYLNQCHQYIFLRDSTICLPI